MTPSYVVRRIFATLALFAGAALVALPGHAAPYAALIVEPSTGKVLHQENASALRHPASLTKMMTLYMVFDALQQGKLRTSQRLRVSKYAASRPPTKLGLRAGDTISVQEVIYGLVTKSANDAATVIAEALGKTESGFAVKMTRKARQLGMKRTTFRNASGLPDRKQITTAWDMYRLALALQRDFPQFYHYFSTPNFHFNKRTYRNHNHLLKNYPGTDGIKTGYIRASGFNLVASVKRGNRRVIGVVFGGRSARTRDAQMRTLLDQGFAKLNVGPSRVMVAKRKPVRPPTYTIQLSSLNQRKIPARTSGNTRKYPANVRTYTGEPGWQVQVGAFSQRSTAREQFGYAFKAIPHLLLRADTRISPFEVNGRTLYRARFVNLDKGEASAACQALRRKNIKCVLVSPTS